MFCYQCEETVNCKGCTIRGVCGKTNEVANLQDMLIWLLKGISVYAKRVRAAGKAVDESVDRFIMDSLFATITNANFDEDDMLALIRKALDTREKTSAALGKDGDAASSLPEAATWSPKDDAEIYSKAEQVGILSTENEDVRSLRMILIYGVKGMAAYAHHAYMLGKKDPAIFAFMQDALASTLDDSLSADALTSLVFKCGEMGVATMALLDSANTSAYGNPEPTKVFTGVGINPGILISGHDLKDMEELLKQTEGAGVDVYTHGEMLPANYYPAFKKYKHLIGNYGGSWWHQDKEFEKFNGPILMTTNCLVPPKDSYRERLYATGVVGFHGIKTIPDRKPGKMKDFSGIIAQAKHCKAPEKLEEGHIVGGFAHASALSYADKIVGAIKAGKIKRFFVMAGCDGRQKERDYYTKFAEALPKDTVILTAGCAKYRYNKLPLGDIDGIPRVLDAGQCNDSYSLVVIGQALAKAFGAKSLNDLPISFNIGWYEQKAVLVLLALLHLGVKNIRLGPKLPAFVSPAVLKVLVDKFNIAPNTSVDNDLVRMMEGN